MSLIRNIEKFILSNESKKAISFLGLKYENKGNERTWSNGCPFLNFHGFWVDKTSANPIYFVSYPIVVVGPLELGRIGGYAVGAGVVANVICYRVSTDLQHTS